MEVGDFVEPEVGVAVAVTAVLSSPSIRKTLRRGAAYGLAGVLLTGDAVKRFAGSVRRGAQDGGQKTPAAGEPEAS